MKYDALLARVHEIYDLRKAARVLTWDREVSMPKMGGADRTNQIATLQKVCHALYTADEMGELIEAAAGELNGAAYESPEASLIRYLRRDYAKARRLPPEFVRRLAALNSQATAIWKQAREADDYDRFWPWLAQIIDLTQEKAKLLGFKTDPYDALLDRYEPGASAADIGAIFDAAKDELLPLYRSVSRLSQDVDDSFLYQGYEVGLQQKFARHIAAAVGYDFSRGHLATAVHPFSTSLSLNDVRITTRYLPDHLSPSIFATLHEAGHAIYVQNVSSDLARTPLAKETSAGLDESQSRLLENMVGRSLGFWRVHLPALKNTFPRQLASVTPETFYQAINKVQPSFIRIEADELTYNIHIILRFELEQALLSGDLSPEDLPAAWNDKMLTYLGVTPPSDRLGCLQDIHWTLVGFGYFPTYALGNLYAAQFYEAALKQNPALEAQLAEGQIAGLMDWLRDNIHRHGRALSPAELVIQATGRKLDHHAFVRYVNDKFGDLYGS
ncbi:MAG: carboxypeptidase M32 [Chloroflexota bacterium]|nr:MAG: carboxypeptidase M32 [Chloroflexota bacterium]